MRWLFALALLACSGKKDDKPQPAPPAPPMIADVPADAPADAPAVIDQPPTTVLDEAARILATGTRRDPDAWVALAHAQAIANRPEAKQTLEAALAAVRADPKARVAHVLAADAAFAAGDPELAGKVLDEAFDRIAKANLGGDSIGVLLSPIVDLQHAPIVERVAKLVTKKNIGDVAFRVQPGSPSWAALLAHVRTIDDGRVEMLRVLAWNARQRGDASAKELATEVARLALKKIEDHDAISIARELALHGDLALVKQLTAPVAKAAHSEEAAERAVRLAQLAEIHAIAGDAPGAQALEKKALLAAAAGEEDLAQDDYGDSDAEVIWGSLAIARARRGDEAGALELVRKHLKGEAIGDVAYGLVEAGAPALVDRVLGLVKGEAAFDAVAEIVEVEARRDLAAAEKRALAGPRFKGGVPGIEHVLRGYALAGDVEAVVRLGGKDKGGLATMQLDLFRGLAATALARQAKCDAAVAAARDVALMRGETYARLARYCASSRP